jgi:DNA-binding transcriptional regulator YhcF (GntR family)
MADRTGYIKIYRELLDKPIWTKSTPVQKVILITILSMANHRETEWEWMGKKFKVAPGQFITSLESIAEKAGVTIKNVRTALEKFEKYEFLANESTKTGRLITITNWQLYQTDEKTTGKAIGKQVAKTRQTGGKEVATNKNDKNEIMKEEIKNIPPDKIQYAEFVTLKESEYNTLIDKHGKDNTDKMIAKLDNYKGQSKKNQKKYDSDYRAILTWVVDEIMNPKKPQQQSRDKPIEKYKAYNQRKWGEDYNDSLYSNIVE